MYRRSELEANWKAGHSSNTLQNAFRSENDPRIILIVLVQKLPSLLSARKEEMLTCNFVQLCLERHSCFAVDSQKLPGGSHIGSVTPEDDISVLIRKG